MKNSTLFQEANINPKDELQSSLGNKLNRYIKRNMYQWHRILGLITIIPVIFWTLSGLMHPFMSHWFKPSIPKEFLVAQPIQKEQCKLSIQEVLDKNKIETIKKFRIVAWSNHTYYQVKKQNGELIYFNASNGKELINGDKIYAEWLARYFLQDQKSKLLDISLQTEFSQHYKYINRLLPVWKLSFERADGIEIYVETASSRLGTFNTNTRKTFLSIFDIFHNWSFLESISNNTLRVIMMLLFLGIILFSSLSGLVIYGFLWKKFKKVSSKTSSQNLLRKYHRQIGIAVSFVTFTFAFSGAYHVTRKLEPNLLPEMVVEPDITAFELQKSNMLLPVEWQRVSNISVVKMRKQSYYQVFLRADEDKKATIEYFDANTGSILPQGNELYAKFLTKIFAKKIYEPELNISQCCELSDISTGEASTDLSNENLLKTKTLYAFDKREYGFVFKRLPVVQLAYDTPNKDSYYIETATSRLAAHVTNSDRAEGYSFAILHKFSLMEWAGKNVRDITTMLAAMGVLVVSLLGFVLFIKK